MKAFREQREKLYVLLDKQADDHYAACVEAGRIPLPPPKDEVEAMEREAARILEERLEKEEMDRRRIVRKRRPKFKRKETPNLRLRFKFTPRQVADVLGIPLFNKPFRVLDRSLLYDTNPETKTIFRKWYVQIAKDAEIVVLHLAREDAVAMLDTKTLTVTNS